MGFARNSIGKGEIDNLDIKEKILGKLRLEGEEVIKRGQGLRKGVRTVFEWELCIAVNVIEAIEESIDIGVNLIWQ